MAKRKTDEEIRTEISLHSRNVRDFLHKSHKIHMEALASGSGSEHIQIMKRVIEFQKLGISEAKKVTRLEKI